MTQHTAGPWTIGKSWDGFVTVTDGSKTICSVGEGDLFPQIEQDARLIAAAPHLLQVLTHIWEVYGKQLKLNDTLMIEQALANAKGEQVPA